MVCISQSRTPKLGDSQDLPKASPRRVSQLRPQRSEYRGSKGFDPGWRRGGGIAVHLSKHLQTSSPTHTW